MSDRKRVLVIDDDPTTASLTNHILEKSGYAVTVARDGLEGIEQFQELKPHLVICDVVMPRMDGLSFCRHLKKSNPQTPIIAISSKSHITDIFLAIGVESFIHKPIDTQVLLSKVISLIGKGGEETPAALKEQEIPQPVVPEPDAKPASAGHDKEVPADTMKVLDASSQAMSKEMRDQRAGKKILVVDDDIILQKILKARLEGAGYTVISASDGKVGLEKVGQEQPSLVITDVLMPTMDGYAFCKAIKKNEATEKIPVLVLTAREKMKDSFEILGADYFTTKPFNVENLLFKIDALVNIKQVLVTKPPPQEPSSPEPVLQSQAAPAPEGKTAEQKTAFSPADAGKKPLEETPPKQEPKQKEAAPAKESAAQAPTATGKKILLYGYDDNTLEKMRGQLAEQNCQVTILKKEKKIVEEVDRSTLHLILLQLHTAEFPIDEVVAELSALIRRKIRESETARKSKKNTPIFLEIPVVFYKVIQEATAGGAGSEELSAMEDLLQHCLDNGATKYIGSYTPMSFISKIKEFIKS